MTNTEPHQPTQLKCATDFCADVKEVSQSEMADRTLRVLRVLVGLPLNQALSICEIWMPIALKRTATYSLPAIFSAKP